MSKARSTSDHLISTKPHNDKTIGDTLAQYYRSRGVILSKPSGQFLDAWLVLPLLAAIVCIVVLFGAAQRETPTFDEYAHVPAGVAHWKYGQFHLHPYNPPAGKMWMAIPLALDRRVVVPRYEGDGDFWEPWRYGQLFEQANRVRYLQVVSRARWMTIPFVLIAGAVVYLWTRQIFGAFAAAMSATLFVLSPTVLAHGHLATFDAMSMATIAVALFAIQRSALHPTWLRMTTAGIAVGLALAVKFTAIFLIVIAPPLWIGLAWSHFSGRSRLPSMISRILVATFAAWLMVNLSMGFSGTFDQVGSLHPRSTMVANVLDRIPAQVPILMPRMYWLGFDTLQFETESNQFPGYLRGQWFQTRKPHYYIVAYLIKESEIVVLLTLLTLLAMPLSGVSWRDAAAVLVPLCVFLLLVAFANALNLGLRYVLPAFPLIFICMGACFRWLERGITKLGDARGFKRFALNRIDKRWWVAAPLVSIAIYTAVANFPGYLSYFNAFVGGSAKGDLWLVGSNLDWGQDLYRLPYLAPKYNVDRWKLLYFGNVSPSLYGIRYDLAPGQPAPGIYAVSRSLLRGMPCAVLFEGGPPHEIEERAAWLAGLHPTEQLGGLAIFDLRDGAAEKYGTPMAYFNAGSVALMQQQLDKGCHYLREAVARDPSLTEAHLQLGLTSMSLENHAEAYAAFRKVLSLQPRNAVALNNLAWYLSVGPDPAQYDHAEAVRLAETACRVTNRLSLPYLDTLADALAAAGRWDDALATHREIVQKADASGQLELAERHREKLADLEDRAHQAKGE